MRIVYFDRNVFDDICELRWGLSHADVVKIQSAVTAGVITILASYTVIEETIGLIHRFEGKYKQHIKTVLDLIDKDRIIKPHTQLLLEDCESYAFRKPTTPRTNVLPRGFREMLDLSLNQEGLAALADEIRPFYVQSAAEIQAWLESAIKASPARARTFQEAWTELAPRAVEDMLKTQKMSRALRRRCKARGITEMLNIRSVRLYTIYRIWTTYSYCLRSDGPLGKMQPSDVGDFLHTVNASAADIFVTQERKDKQGKLPFILSQVPTPRLTVMNLNEFLETL